MISLAAVLMHVELAKAEDERFKSLKPEERAEELRVREVQALERMARAAENTRRDVYHHIF